jgi:hypothetical protein
VLLILFNLQKIQQLLDQSTGTGCGAQDCKDRCEVDAVVVLEAADAVVNVFSLFS